MVFLPEGLFLDIYHRVSAVVRGGMPPRLTRHD